MSDSQRTARIHIDCATSNAATAIRALSSALLSDSTHMTSVYLKEAKTQAARLQESIILAESEMNRIAP